jgi:hypothetical protein
VFLFPLAICNILFIIAWLQVCQDHNLECDICQVESEGFWWWCIVRVLGISGFLDFAHRPELYTYVTWKTFCELVQWLMLAFPKGPNRVCASLSSSENGNLCSKLYRMPDDGQSPEIRWLCFLLILGHGRPCSLWSLQGDPRCIRSLWVECL